MSRIMAIAVAACFIQCWGLVAEARGPARELAGQKSHTDQSDRSTQVQRSPSGITVEHTD